MQLEADVRRGLASHPKFIPLRWHWDTRGEALFAKLGSQPEYYLARAEAGLIARDAGQIVASGRGTHLIDLGSGMVGRVRMLLDALRAEDRLEGYCAIDIDQSSLESSLPDLARDYPEADVGGIVADFLRQTDQIPSGDHRIVALLGGTFGNFTASERSLLLESLRRELRPGEEMLLGADLVKEPETILRAYDDAAGITASFDLNILRVLNRHLDADFDRDSFTHHVRWNSIAKSVEMSLVAERDMEVDVSALEMDVSFKEGEHLQTGFSVKFDPDELTADFADRGFSPEGVWLDEGDGYGLFLFKAV